MAKLRLSYEHIEPIFNEIIERHRERAILTNQYILRELNRELIKERKKRHTINTNQLGVFIGWQKNYYAFSRNGTHPVEYIFVKYTEKQRSAYRQRMKFIAGGGG